MFWVGALAGIAAWLIVSVLVLAVIVALAESQRKREVRRQEQDERRKAVEEVERWVKQR